MAETQLNTLFYRSVSVKEDFRIKEVSCDILQHVLILPSNIQYELMLHGGSKMFLKNRFTHTKHCLSCAGSIIRCMRRLEEVLRQMCSAAKAIGNTELENKFAEGKKHHSVIRAETMNQLVI